MIIKDLSRRELNQNFEEDILSIDSKHLAYPWKKELWQDVFINKDSKFLLCSALQEGELVGFSLFELNKWSLQAHLLKIVTSPEVRGSGLASKLFLFCKDHIAEAGMREIYLEVEAGNTRAISFYRKNLFLTLCVKGGYYSDGADAQAMLLSL